MFFYTIDSLSVFIDNPLVAEYHSVMFHGLAKRNGLEYPHDRTVFAHEEASQALTISRCGGQIPPIFKPSTHFVVNAQVARQLQRLQHVRLQPVILERLVDVAFRKGDMSWYEQPNCRDPNELLRKLPDVPPLTYCATSWTPTTSLCVNTTPPSRASIDA